MFKAGVDAVSKVIVDTLFSIAFFFDNIVYSFIPKLYKLIIYLANVNLFGGNSAVKALLNRVYILVGVFMLFKLAFSILRYIVDPSAFTDQNKGFTNLVKRILIALVLLVSVNPLFDKIYEVQNIIISKNLISNLILGSNSSSDVTVEEAASDVQFLIFGPFFSINPIGSLSVCASDPDSGYPLSNIIGTTDMALKEDGECLNNFAKAMDASSNAQASGVKINDFFDVDQRDFSSLGVLISVEEPDTGGRVVNYLPVFSTLCAGYLVFLLLSFCIDIGARALKLLFLQILSPIAIISSVDPTESSQDTKLKEWGRECLTTFVGLFIRLAVVFLVIQMVKVITAKLFDDTNLYYSGFSHDTSLNIFVYIFLILGAFQVAKKIPDLIGQAFGVKLSGDLQLNPFKNPFVSSALGLGLTGAQMLGANAYSFVKRGVSSVKKLNEEDENGETGFSKAVSAYRTWRQNVSQYKAAREYANQHPPIGGGTNAAQRRAMALQNQMRNARKSFFNSDVVFEAKQSASSLAGIFTGAAAGAARGAAGAYGKGLTGAFQASNQARNVTTDKRNDRDSRAEANHEAILRGDKKPYTVRTRIENAMDQFASVKSSKDHGVGLYSERVKTAQMDLSNLQRQLSRTVEGLADARLKYDGAGISDANIKKLMSQLDELIATGSSDEREKWAKSIGAAVGSASLSNDQRSIVESVANTVTRMDSLTDAVRAKEKEISKMNDIANNNAKNNS